jgi:hypothetical protein
MTENWKAVPGYEGLYEVSDLGRVRSLPRNVFVSGVRGCYSKHVKGRMLAPQRHNGGYRQVSLCGRLRLIHALVLEAFVGPRPAGAVAMHADDDRTNNAVSNLAWGTSAENSGQMAARKRSAIGVRNGSAKLCKSEVDAIRAAAGTCRQKDLAAKFGVQQQHISRILRGERRQHG